MPFDVSGALPLLREFGWLLAASDTLTPLEGANSGEAVWRCSAGSYADPTTHTTGLHMLTMVDASKVLAWGTLDMGPGVRGSGSSILHMRLGMCRSSLGYIRVHYMWNQTWDPLGHMLPRFGQGRYWFAHIRHAIRNEQNSPVHSRLRDQTSEAYSYCILELRLNMSILDRHIKRVIRHMQHLPRPN